MTPKNGRIPEEAASRLISSRLPLGVLNLPILSIIYNIKQQKRHINESFPMSDRILSEKS